MFSEHQDTYEENCRGTMMSGTIGYNNNEEIQNLPTFQIVLVLLLSSQMIVMLRPTLLQQLQCPMSSTPARKKKVATKASNNIRNI